MTTRAEKDEIARIERNDRSALKVGWSTLLGGLAVSTGFNLLSGVVDGFDPYAMVIAGLPPLSLFVLSLLLERLEVNWVVKFGLTASLLVSLAFSWYHIAAVVQHYHQPSVIAWFFPMIIDVPMLLAGMSIMAVRNRRNKAIRTSQTSVTVPAKKTTPARATVAPQRASRARKATATNAPSLATP